VEIVGVLGGILRHNGLSLLEMVSLFRSLAFDSIDEAEIVKRYKR
jgi:hypothetical protein